MNKPKFILITNEDHLFDLLVNYDELDRPWVSIQGDNLFIEEADYHAYSGTYK